VIGTGETRSVREFVVEAFGYAGVELQWRGAGLQEQGIVRSLDPLRVPASAGLKPGDTVVHIDKRYFRPAEVDFLLADPEKAKRCSAGSRSSRSELVRCMTDADLRPRAAAGRGARILARHGYEWILNRRRWREP
jgi:GDPmannose 4,6-dehydratase